MLERLLHHILHILQIPELCQVLHPVLIAVSESECCLYCIRCTIGLLYFSLWLVLAEMGILYSLWVMCWTSHSYSAVVGLFQLLLTLLKEIHPRIAVYGPSSCDLARAPPFAPYVFFVWPLDGAGAVAAVLVTLPVQAAHPVKTVPVTAKQM